jgi:hypothetical protein
LCQSPQNSKIPFVSKKLAVGRNLFGQLFTKIPQFFEANEIGGYDASVQFSKQIAQQDFSATHGHTADNKISIQRATLIARTFSLRIIFRCVSVERRKHWCRQLVFKKEIVFGNEKGIVLN